MLWNGVASTAELKFRAFPVVVHVSIAYISMKLHGVLQREILFVRRVVFQLLKTATNNPTSFGNPPRYSRGCCAGYDFYLALHLEREQVYMIYLVFSIGHLRDRCHGPLS